MGKERNSEPVLDRAVAQVERRYRQVGFDGLTDNQKVLLCVHDAAWSDFVEYFNRDIAGLTEGDEEPTEGDWEQFESFEAEHEQWQDWATVGLRRIGAPKAGKAFEKARTTCDWDKWEQRFRNAEDIDELLLAFVREHPEDFPAARAR